MVFRHLSTAFTLTFFASRTVSVAEQTLTNEITSDCNIESTLRLRDLRLLLVEAFKCFKKANLDFRKR